MSASHLASIYGTEKDQVNCPFYYKIGACRHGAKCSRYHNKPPLSNTILLPNLYQNPLWTQQPVVGGHGPPTGRDQQQAGTVDRQEVLDHFEDFVIDMWEELAKFGDVKNIEVCENVGPHLIGNVYVNFYDEDAAAEACQKLAGRFYAGRAILPEFSPVTDFREATCRQHTQGDCQRGGFCNFLHSLPASPSFFGELKKTFNKKHTRQSRSRSRSRGRDRSRSRRRDSYRDRSRDRDRSRGRDRHRSRRRRRSRSRSRSRSPRDRERRSSRSSRKRERSPIEKAAPRDVTSAIGSPTKEPKAEAKSDAAVASELGLPKKFE